MIQRRGVCRLGAAAMAVCAADGGVVASDFVFDGRLCAFSGGCFPSLTLFRVEVFRADSFVGARICPNRIAATVYARRVRRDGLRAVVKIPPGERWAA